LLQERYEEVATYFSFCVNNPTLCWIVSYIYSSKTR